MDYRLSISSIPEYHEMESRINQTLDEAIVSQSFHEAAREGNVCMMEEILKAVHKSVEEIESKTFQRRILHLRLNAKDQKQMTALHYAAQNNHIEICQLLMTFSKPLRRTGAMEKIALDMELISYSELDIHAQNHEGATPLHLAARYTTIKKKDIPDVEDRKGLERLISQCYESKTAVSQILEWCHAINVHEITTHLGMTPLHWAARKNNIDAAVKLLTFQPQKAELKWKPFTCPAYKQCVTKNNQALLHAKDKQGFTALHVCAIHNSTATAILLIESGADVTAQDTFAWTPLHLAASEGHMEVGKVLIEHAATDKTKLKAMLAMETSQKYTPLHVATEKNHTKAVKMLLALGGESVASKVTLKGSTALHFAASIGNMDVIKSLLQMVNNVNSINNMGRSALHCAAYCNKLEVVKLLVAEGADVNLKDRRGMTALLLACKNGNKETVENLLEIGGDLIVKDQDGMTCLHWASIQNKVQIVKILMEDKMSGQLVNKRNCHRFTALHLASARGHHKVVQLLCAKSDLMLKDHQENSAIHLAAEKGHVKALKLLLQKNLAQLHAKSRHGNTPLLIAAKHGRENAVKFLLESKANVDEKNSKRFSALTFCAMSDHTKCATVLLEAGASLDYAEQCSAKPLHAACSNGSVNMVNLLLKHNASVSALDYDGNNPLDLAIKHGHKCCVRAIIESPKWKGAVRSARICAENGYVSTPLRDMIKTMPDMASLLFSKCTRVSPNLTPSEPEYNIQFDFEFLDDAYSVLAWKALQEGGENAADDGQAPCYEVGGILNTMSKPYTERHGVLRTNHPLAIMVEHGSSELLSHPLVNILLTFKWRKYGRVVYYALLLLYLCFMLPLTGYLLAIPPPYAVQIEGQGKNACFILKDGANPLWNKYACECCQHGNLKNGIMTFLAVMIGFFASVNLIKEGFQIWRTGWEYLKSVDNYFEVTSYLLSLIVIIDWTEMTSVTGIKEVWQWNLASVCLLSSWLTLALFVRKLPTLGIYVIMFLNIVQTFGKFFVTFMLYITAFALFFYMMLQNQEVFQTVWQSVVKTFVMMIGELDYSSMFFGEEPDCTNHTETCTTFRPVVSYPEVTTVVYLTFLVLMPIITMNLLVGLAVDDIKSIQEQATKQKMAMQINLALDVEFLIPEMMRKHLTVEKYVMYPNKHVNRNWLIRFFLDDPDFIPEAITKALSAEKEMKELLVDQYREAARHNEDVTNKLESLIKQNKQLSETMAELSKRLNSANIPVNV